MINQRKQVLISTAIFIATMFGGVMHAQEPLYRINREIAQTRHSIDSVRRAHTTAMARQLYQNTNYRYIQENSDYIDTLEHENERLLTRAVELIRRARPGKIIIRNSVVFITYRDIPGVATIGQMYRNNQQRMYEYNRHVTAFQPEYQAIKNKCDSAMHAKIDMYQLRLDSLLNRKLELIR